VAHGAVEVSWRDLGRMLRERRTSSAPGLAEGRGPRRTGR
jgi:hypothetical protein